MRLSGWEEMAVTGLKVGIWGVADDLGTAVIHYNTVHCKYHLIEMYFGLCNLHGFVQEI